MKLIFTDIDGVLNSDFDITDIKDIFKVVAKRRVKYLKQIIDSTKAEVVIVSKANSVLGKALPRWRTLIRHSFLSEEMKNRYEELITSRLSRL